MQMWPQAGKEKRHDIQWADTDSLTTAYTAYNTPIHTGTDTNAHICNNITLQVVCLYGKTCRLQGIKEMIWFADVLPVCVSWIKVSLFYVCVYTSTVSCKAMTVCSFSCRISWNAGSMSVWICTVCCGLLYNTKNKFKTHLYHKHYY